MYLWCRQIAHNLPQLERRQWWKNQFRRAIAGRTPQISLLLVPTTNQLLQIKRKRKYTSDTCQSKLKFKFFALFSNFHKEKLVNGYVNNRYAFPNSSFTKVVKLILYIAWSKQANSFPVHRMCTLGRPFLIFSNNFKNNRIISKYFNVLQLISICSHTPEFNENSGNSL